MRVLRSSSEHEMIAVFLRAELDSSRYGQMLRGFLVRDGRDEGVLRRPDLGDPDANRYRGGLLEEYRAYERRDGLFGGFPRQVDWFRAALTRDEALDVLFINWHWWLKISDGTRRPRVAARRIRGGLIPGCTVEEHEPLAAALQGSPPPPELIVATTPAYSPLVVFEGHFRLTAYALFPDYVPDELEVLLGVSEEMAEWCQL
jgi:hypothetical protein